MCKTPRLSLADLARASGVSLNAIKQLEQNPPNKDRTWEHKWRGRIAAWIPRMEHAFLDVLESKALTKCPPRVLAQLRQDYEDWATSTQAVREPLRANLVEAQRMQLFADAQAHAYRHDWENAEKIAARTAPTVFAQRMRDLENAQSLVAPGCVEDAYGTWFIGVAMSVSGDLIAGRRLIERSAHLLHENGLAVASVRQPQISLIHNTLRSSAWNAEVYKNIESNLHAMMPQFALDRSPYANALASLTLAYTRLLRDASPTQPNDRKMTTDWLCLALLAHPYPKHPMWPIAIQLLKNNIMPNLYAKERKGYAKTSLTAWHIPTHPFTFLTCGDAIPRFGQMR
ncbi:MAG: hypothetical protein HC853_04510 [Anaerolineae bacterium]|nr:hypothetical protein [Anaerolineae bacterium]